MAFLSQRMAAPHTLIFQTPGSLWESFRDDFGIAEHIEGFQVAWQMSAVDQRNFAHATLPCGMLGAARASPRSSYPWAAPALARCRDLTHLVSFECEAEI